MASTADLQDFLDAYHRGMDEFMRGNCEEVKPLFTRTEGTTLANPFGPVAKGWVEVVSAMERAAENYRDGKALGFDNISTVVTPDLALVVEIERLQAKVGGRVEPSVLELRVTTVLRPEQGVWKIVHRHADPITTPRPPESVLPA